MLPTSSVVRHHEEQSDVQCVCAWCSQDKSLWLTSGMFWDFQCDAENHWEKMESGVSYRIVTKSKSYKCYDTHSRFYHSPATLAIFTSYFRFVHFGPRICPVGGAQHAVKRFTPVRPPPAKETLKHLPRQHTKPRNLKPPVWKDKSKDHQGSKFSSPLVISSMLIQYAPYQTF